MRGDAGCPMLARENQDMKHLLLIAAASTFAVAAAQAQETGLDHTMYRLGIPGGFAVTPDMVGLVVSQPDSVELVYFNTLTEKEVKRVELDFKPGALAIKEKSLFAAGKGSSVIYQLELNSAKVQKEFEIPGDAVARIAVHPTKPLLFASTASFEIFAVDLAKGKVTKTAATGDQLAVSPDGEFLVAAMQPPLEDGKLVWAETPDGKIRYLWDDWGARAIIAKYKIAGSELKLESAQNNAAVNGYVMHLTPDGKRVMMTGGGGWRPPVGGGTGGGYVTAIFSTGNLQSMLGQAIAADAVVFHPVLNLAATNQGGRDIVVINGKSFKERQKISIAPGAGGGTTLFAFVGKGTKVAIYNGANPAAPKEGLHFFDLELSAEERAQLTKIYGKLPEPLSAEEVATKPEEPEPTTTAKTKPETPKVAKTLGKTLPKAEPKPEPMPRVASTSGTKKPTGPVEALAGFNDAKGINADKKKFSPYPLGVLGQQPGQGEPGWAGAWRVDDKITYQKEIVQEGDGAMFITGTTVALRQLAVPMRGKVEVEQFVRLPAGGDVKAYIGKDEGASGPMWMAFDGKFYVIDGNGEQFAQQDSAIADVPCEPDTWYKVTVKIDVPSRTYEFFIDDKKFEHAPFKFRGKADVIGELRYLTEKPEGVFIDAVRVSPLKDESKQR